MLRETKESGILDIDFFKKFKAQFNLNNNKIWIYNNVSMLALNNVSHEYDLKIYDMFPSIMNKVQTYARLSTKSLYRT